MQIYEVMYIGQCRDKGHGSQAFGWVNNSWSVIFPEKTLRDWFEAGPAPQQAPSNAASLYSMLGVSKTATGEEIKSDFRKAARQWNPDVCKEPNAHEMFIRVKEAHDILSDPRKRGRYDAGLALEATLKKPDYKQMAASMTTGSYRSPLRCGMIAVDGQQSGKWFVVTGILLWEDVVRGNQILVASWPMGANQPVENWV